MKVRRADPAGSRIVLIGTPAYADASLPDVPVVANNITDLARVLTDAAVGGFDPQHCHVAPARASLEDVGECLARAAREAEDLLLVYYAGHGLLGPRRRELYLSLAATRPDRLAFTALPFDAVRDACLDSRARSRVVVLDSCFSGRAIGETLADDAVLGQLEVTGSYTLTAAPANRTALVMPGERHTAFTERLLHLLRTGTSEAGPHLTLGDIYRHLRARLLADGLPEPQQRGTGVADLLALTLNPGYLPPTPPKLPSAVIQEDLPAGLESRYPKMRAAAVHELTAWLTDPDPRRVLAALTALQDISDTDGPEAAGFARTAVNNRQPEAGTIRQEPGRSDSADSGRKPLIAERRQRATAALETAEKIAQGITDEWWQAWVLAEVARAVAAIDPDRAERITWRISDPWLQAWVLGEIVRVVAVSSADRAESIARSLTDETSQAWVLAEVAGAVAATDPDWGSRLADQAEQIAQSVTDKRLRAQALAEVAQALAATDPDRASRLADEAHQIVRGTNDGFFKAQVLEAVVQALGAIDPDRAERIARTVPHESLQARVLAALVQAEAATDPDRAERIARSITNETLQAQALADVARAVAATDPDRTEQIARTVTDERSQALLLAVAAQVWLA